LPPTIYRGGTVTFHCEVTSIDELGFWILVEKDGELKEYFVPFSDYPGFRKATVEQIFAVEQSSPKQLRWAELDEDIELDALENPENYPLVF